MNIYPYVYRLDHPATGEFYIGYRCGNKVPAEQDLGHKYFTSSKYVKPRFHEFTTTIVAEFFDSNAAYELEQELIHELWYHDKILNKSCHFQKKQFKTEKGRKCKPFSESHKLNISNSLTGKLGTNTGKEFSAQTKLKMSLAKINKPGNKKGAKLSEASKLLMRQRALEQTRVCRIIDKKEMNLTSYTRWTNSLATTPV